MVSAVIITHNRSNLLVRAINSVKKQTYKDIEIIVVDDASTDDTFDVCKKIDGIKYIRIEKASGGNHARNVGVQASKGEYIAFLDDDDYWYDNKIEKQMEFIQKNPEFGVIYSGYKVDFSSKIYNYNWYPRKNFSGDLVKKQLYISPFCCTITLLIKRQLLIDVGLFDENVRYWQEYELLLRLIQVTKIGYVNEILAAANRNRKVKRLTGQLDGWIDSMNYINRKHNKLFEQLSEDNLKKKLIYYYSEAAYRASASGNKKKMRMYYKEAFKVSKKFEFFIRWIFGISRQNTLLLECIIKRIKCRKV